MLKSVWWYRTACALSALLLVVALWPAGSAAQSPRFTGQAAAVRAMFPGTQTVLADTGTLTSSGDVREASDINPNLPGVLSGESLHATAIGMEDRTMSEASLAGLNIAVGRNIVAADFIMASASAVCNGATPMLSGWSEVFGLTVNGSAVRVTGKPNQNVSFPGGKLVINEQRQTGDTTTVNALRITVNGVADVAIGSTQAGIRCGS